MIATLRAVRLPVTFEELGKADGVSEVEMQTIVDATLATGYSRHMTPLHAPERLAQCLVLADRAGVAANSAVGS